MKKTHPLVKKLTERWLQTSPGPVGVIAISGGPDSVALARAAWTARARLGGQRLILAHLNHLLRGPESAADEAFVQAIPNAWHADTSLTVITTRLPIAEQAQALGQNLEQTAREARYRWLCSLAEQQQATWVATGHTADDQAETVLHRLLRGTGLQGLRGIAASRQLSPTVTLFRPLLDVSRAEVLDYLHSENQPYRVDASNLDLTFTRNKLRHKTLPELSQTYNPNLAQALTQLANQAEEVYAELATQAQTLLTNSELPRAGDMIVLAQAKLLLLSPMLLRELYRLVWQREGWPMGKMSRDHWLKLLPLTQGTLPSCDFPAGVKARQKGAVVQLWRDMVEPAGLDP